MDMTPRLLASAHQTYYGPAATDSRVLLGAKQWRWSRAAIMGAMVVSMLYLALGAFLPPPEMRQVRTTYHTVRPRVSDLKTLEQRPSTLETMYSNANLPAPYVRDQTPVKVQGPGLAHPVLSTTTVILTHADMASAKGQPNPEFFNFQPVCPAADGVFRVGQALASSVAGDQAAADYRPLINDVLIRVRTELCVLESFIRETATPFIQEKGVGWILPLHETSETYVAGVVFMVGANFILLGSTKVVAILAIYIDLLIGLPSRLLGSAFVGLGKGPGAKFDKKIDAVMEEQMAGMKKLMERNEGQEALQKLNADYANRLEDLKQQKLAAISADTNMNKASGTFRVIGGPLAGYGKVSLTIRQALEVFDTFCSRYFVTFTVAYIVIKTVHYIILPDIF